MSSGPQIISYCVTFIFSNEPDFPIAIDAANNKAPQGRMQLGNMYYGTEVDNNVHGLHPVVISNTNAHHPCLP